jgi:hypothetical protein
MNIERIERVTKSGPHILYDAVSPIAPDHAALVRELENFLTRYVILPAHTVLQLALWALMTHTFRSFDAVPYLVITSPAPRCGKTRLLECLELAVSAPRRASNVSEAALFRMIEKISPTLLLDEAETLSGKSERAEYFRQILNAGNRRGAVVTRCTGQGLVWTPMIFQSFVPKCLRGLGTFHRQSLTARSSSQCSGGRIARRSSDSFIARSSR